jgi:hypothetical protein
MCRVSSWPSRRVRGTRMAIGVATTCTGVASGVVRTPFLCLPCSFSTRSVLAKVNNDIVRVVREAVL